MSALVEAEKSCLTIERGNQREKLEVLAGFPETAGAEAIFQQFGLMHIVAPSLPLVIRTNFPVSESVRDFIGRMYVSSGRMKPDFNCPAGENKPVIAKLDDAYGALVTFTGGKDSLWNLMRARQEFERVLAVHIGGLNQVVASREREYVNRQKAAFGFDLRVIEIKNGRDSRGYIMMRSRDFFLTALSIPLAVENGASRIILEGGFYVGGEEKGAAFCYQMSAWEAFNKMLSEMGLPVCAAWYDERTEVEKVRDLLQQKPEWLKMVINCLSMPCFVSSIRRELLERVGDFPLYESQCGGCVKCRTVNIARILYDHEMAKVKPEVVRSYVLGTMSWLRRKKNEIGDIVDESFFEAVKLAAEKYGLN